MEIQEIFNNKDTKPKEKTAALSQWVVDHPDQINRLIDFARNAKDPVKATCIEALEYATKINPELGSVACLEFVISTLSEKAPRIKWESARVIGNIAHLYPKKLDDAITKLLENSEHSGTVVRWSAAFALGQILKMKTTRNKNLIPAIEAICNREEKNSIRKIYLDALKKSMK